jgi:hypothetical protein
MFEDQEGEEGEEDEEKESELEAHRCSKLAAGAGSASHLPTRVLPSSSIDRARQYRARSGLSQNQKKLSTSLNGPQRIP